MMDVIARTGSFAAAARELGKVPSSLTYSVRQLEDALDVLLFDRRSRQARLTAAGEELLERGPAPARADGRGREPRQAGRHRLGDAAQHRRRRRDLAADACSSCARRSTRSRPSPTARRVADGAAPAAAVRAPACACAPRCMAGTWEALVTGQADLAIGVGCGREPTARRADRRSSARWRSSSPSRRTIRSPRAAAPISDAELLRHRAVAVADSAQRLAPLTVNLLPGQDVLTVSSMQAKIEAQLRCLGCGFVPEPLAREHIAAGRLVVKAVAARRATAPPRLRLAPAAAPRAARQSQAALGLALRWWLEQLESPTTRAGAARAPRQRRTAAASCEAPASTAPMAYIGRFAPSPTGPLHAGSLVAALASGSTRAPTAGAGWCASRTSTRRAASPAPPRRSSPARAPAVCCPTRRRSGSRRATRCYAAALAAPRRRRLGLPLRLQPSRPAARRGGAGRRAAARHGELVYPGTCRAGLRGTSGAGRCASSRRRRSTRPDASSRSTGPTAGSAPQRQDVVARGRRLRACAAPTASGPTSSRSSSTTRRRASPTSCAARTWPTTRARQIHLQRLLGLPTPRYLHTPLVLGADGEKLSKQNGARPLDRAPPLAGAARGRHGCSALDVERRRPLSPAWLADATCAAGAHAGVDRRSAPAR